MDTDTTAPTDDDARVDHDLTAMHNNFGASRIVVNDENGRLLEIPIDGTSDPAWVAVAKRYAPQMNALGRGDPQRQALSLKMLHELADLKAAIAAQNAPAPEPEALVSAAPAHVPTNDKPAKQYGVTFDFGEIGTHRATYGHVQVTDNLVLMASPVNQAGGYYAPPADRELLVSIDGFAIPLHVMLVGSYPFAGWTHTLLLVVRTPETGPQIG